MVFAVRESEGQPTKWISLGDPIGGFIALSYETKDEALTLKGRDGQIVLRLPESRVQIKRDEVFVGLERILNVPGARTLCDFWHPMLRPLVKEADFDSRVFSAMLAPGSRIEIREIPEYFEKALARACVQNPREPNE